MAQETQTGALYEPRGGGMERASKGRFERQQADSLPSEPPIVVVRSPSCV